ncbi:hypothetical protein, unlikely [Trypanosoma brucei brucei TREU927]|uniref:Uncharacterized protein n=1 Tax=Trypanosoma brucei brucei (strain 927/4 GUTat10.1) TaxID=185431 RepID=Q38FD3_TRYB2|nr:hypothetical protein, unlikely [Trypanosoma brucei brucei TREU927]EAN76487.1 hypothetical protein, unlikely [Trypanosoma brucei brucei TREU927]
MTPFQHDASHVATIGQQVHTSGNEKYGKCITLSELENNQGKTHQ